MKTQLLALVASAACFFGSTTAFAQQDVSSNSVSQWSTVEGSFGGSNFDDQDPEPDCETLCDRLRDAQEAHQTALNEQAAAATAVAEATTAATNANNALDAANQAVTDALTALGRAQANGDPTLIARAQQAVYTAEDNAIAATQTAIDATRDLSAANNRKDLADDKVEETAAALAEAQANAEGCDCDE